jgi:hypothetical protein
MSGLNLCVYEGYIGAESAGTYAWNMCSGSIALINHCRKEMRLDKIKCESIQPLRRREPCPCSDISLFPSSKAKASGALRF